MKEMVEELSSLVELRKEVRYMIHGEGIHNGNIILYRYDVLGILSSSKGNRR